MPVLNKSVENSSYCKYVKEADKRLDELENQ
jgi:hypothetical protein